MPDKQIIDVRRYLPELRRKAALLLIHQYEEEIKKLRKIVRTRDAVI